MIDGCSPLNPSDLPPLRIHHTAEMRLLIIRQHISHPLPQHHFINSITWVRFHMLIPFQLHTRTSIDAILQQVIIGFDYRVGRPDLLLDACFQDGIVRLRIVVRLDDEATAAADEAGVVVLLDHARGVPVAEGEVAWRASGAGQLLHAVVQGHWRWIEKMPAQHRENRRLSPKQHAEFVFDQHARLARVRGAEVQGDGETLPVLVSFRFCVRRVSVGDEAQT